MSTAASELPAGQVVTAATGRPRPLTEQIADAIRNREHERLTALSTYAGCLFPLLRALGWDNCDREVIEALPHFGDALDLVDFRNILLDLGYRSDACDTQAAQLTNDMLPCLFVDAQEQVFVLLDRSTEGLFEVFNAQTREREVIAFRGSGTAYLFTDTYVTHAVVPERPDEDWFGTVLRRFQGLIKHLLGMTLLLNLIALTVPLYTMVVYDRIIGARDMAAVPSFAAGIGFLLCVEFALRWLRARTLGVTGARIDYLVGTTTLRQILGLPPIMTERSSIAAQLSRLRQFDSVREFFSGPAAMLALELPFIALFIAVIAVLGGWLVAVPVGAMFVIALITALVLPTLRHLTRHGGAAKTNRDQVLMETLNGVRELKSLGAEAIWHERFRETSADTATAHLRTANAQATLQAVTTMITRLAGTLVILLGARAVMSGDLSVGALIAILALLWRVLGPLQALCMTYVRFEQITLGIRGINQLMNLRPERRSRRTVLINDDFNGAIRFDRVSFRYSRDADPALIGVSFDIRPREFVVVTGENSSGKSTLLKLICGLYAVPSGTVTIDGIDTRQFNADDLRRLIAYMPQHPRLFHGTFAQNLRLKNVLATDEELRRAAEAAGVLSDVLAYPDGFDTRIGDNTTGALPNGLVRGLCLARTLLRHTPILLLDEPTAGVDRVRDARLLEQFERLKGTTTVVLVSNRPTHVALADKVIHLSNGMIESVSRSPTSSARS